MTRMVRIAAACAAVTLTVGLAACGSDSGPDAQRVDTRPTATAPGVALPPATVTPADPVHKESVGTKAWVTNPDGSPLLNFTVTKFRDVVCDQAATPANGRFIAAELTVNTFDDPQSRLGTIELNKGWRWAGPDGGVRPANTSQAGQCHSETQSLEVNHPYTAVVVLDVPPSASNDVVSFVVANTYWEWPLDA